MFGIGYWAFGQFMLTISPTISIATFWGKAIFLWPFLMALSLHFSLAFTESDLLKNKLLYVALYFPPVLFSLIDVTTYWISLPPTLKSWGYTYSVPLYSWISRIDGIWAAIISLLMLFLFASYYNRIIDKTRKQQTKFIAVAFAIPIFLDLVTDSLFPIMGIDFPGLGAISASFTSFLVVYAMLKYELFGFRPEIAAENVFSTMLDSLILVNLRGVIVKVNRALLEVTGYAENELLGTSVGEMVQKAGVLSKGNTTPEIIAGLRKQREVKNYEIKFHTKLGQEKSGMLSCSMVSDSKGQDVGMAFVLRDITERKEMEEKLIKSERLASIGELAGILGHDLRNPLNAIGVAAYYLKTKYANVLDKKDEVMFESIDSSINYSNKIVNDLIDYSSEIRLDLESVTPKSLVNNALAFSSAPQNIVVLDKTCEAPTLEIDAGKITRAFANIIKNAFDAMPRCGILTINCAEEDEMVVFTFKDTGEGMSKETLDKLWLPLFTTKAKGMGFGLAICKRAVESHTGEISAESQLNFGTTIKVKLPQNLRSSNT